MRLYLHYKLMCQGEDSPQAIWRLERWQREKEVRELVTPPQPTVHDSAVHAVADSFFAFLKGEVPPHDRTGRDQIAENYVGAKVHMMMSIYSIRFTVKAPEFVELRRYDVLE